MKKKIGVIAFIFFLLFMGYYTDTKAQTINLKYATFLPPTHHLTLMAQNFAVDIAKRTNGKVKITVHAGGTLLNAVKMYNGVQTGIADIGISHCAYTRGRFPVMEALELPLGFSSGYVGSMVSSDFYKKVKPTEWNAIHPLYFHSANPNWIQTLNKPVKTLEELNGMKIRATGRVADLVKALGGNPIPLEMADLYESLRRGVIDGNMGPIEMMKSWKVGELLRYATTSWGIGSVYAFYVVMNKNKYDQLPADIKKIFNEVSSEYVEKQAIEWNKADIDGIAFMKTHGGQLVSLTDAEMSRWVKASEPLIDAYVKHMVSKGFKEKDIREYLSYIKERIRYWKGQEKERGIPTIY